MGLDAAAMSYESRQIFSKKTIYASHFHPFKIDFLFTLFADGYQFLAAIDAFYSWIFGSPLSLFVNYVDDLSAKFFKIRGDETAMATPRKPFSTNDGNAS